MGRRALAQVDLDRVRAPGARPVAADDEVDRRAADRSLRYEQRADPVGGFGDGARVRGRGGKATADAAVVLDDLIVRGDDARTAALQLELDTRAAQLPRDDPLLDDPAAPLESLEVVVQRDVDGLQAHRVDPFGDLQQLRAGARAAEAAQFDDRVALAGDAVVELDHRLPDPRPDGAQARDRGDHVGAAAHVLDPELVRDAGAREQLPPAALGPEVGERGV